ncbi:MAG: exodeoxyribonuclease VII small subunit [Candidatus Hydrogenedentota bacterium]
MAEPKFEKDLEKLEKIVESLEEGGLSLDVSLKKFEEGIQLAQRCEKALSSAEKKIEKLTRRADGALKTSALDEEDEESDEDDSEDDGEEDEVDEDGELLF